MYYLAKIRFESEDDSGKVKKIREHYLVSASSPGEVEKKIIERFGSGVSECQIESIQESKVLGMIE